MVPTESPACDRSSKPTRTSRRKHLPLSLHHARKWCTPRPCSDPGGRTRQEPFSFGRAVARSTMAAPRVREQGPRWQSRLSGSLGGASQASYGWAYGVHTRMLVAFSLEGGASLPVQPDRVVPEPIEADFEVDAEIATAGADFFGQRCSICHGPGSVYRGLTPDLRSSRIVSSLERFASIVRDGRRAEDGMPAYRDIPFSELVSLQHYIRDRAEAALALVEGGGS